MSEEPFNSIFIETDIIIGPPDGYVSIPFGLQDEVGTRHLAWGYGQTCLAAILRAQKDPDLPQLAFPALFLARHTIELYLKGLVPDWRNLSDNGTTKARTSSHNLHLMAQALRTKLQREHKERDILRISTILEAIHRLDPGSMAFRYKDGGPKDGLLGYDDKVDTQVCVNLAKLQEALSWLFDFFDMQWARQDYRESTIAAMRIEAETLEFDFSELARELRHSDDLSEGSD